MDPEGGAGARQTCERVSPSVAEATHGGQHLLLGAKGIQVPLGLGVPAVLSQAWKGRGPRCTESGWEGWAHSRRAGHTQPRPGHRGGTFAKPRFPHSVPPGAGCPSRAGGDPTPAWPGGNLALVPRGCASPSPIPTPFSKHRLCWGLAGIVRTTPGGAQGRAGTHLLGLCLARFQRVQ